VPAGLVNRHNGTCADESVSLGEWRDSARVRILSRAAEKRTAELRKLSSLSHLVEFGTDYSTVCAHPYTTSTNGKAASLWFKIRSNTIPLGRLLAKSQRGVSDKCKCCKRAAREDLMHFLCDCPALRKVRTEWIRTVKEKFSECTITLKDIPKFVLGPASAIQTLPHDSTQQKVAAVEKLLIQLWHARNALHFGSQSAGGERRTLSIRRRSHENTREYSGGSRIDTSNDSHSLNANHSIDTTASERLTRSRARLLLQSTHGNTEGPCQYESTPQATVLTLNASDKKNDRAPRVQRSRPARLESMEIISKT
jgi:hypothetical protein